MSFVKVVKLERKRIIELQCDYCNEIYTKKYSKHFFDQDKLTYCSKQCYYESLRKGEKSNKKIELTCKKRYGASCPTQSEIVKSKSKLTCIQKYGVDHHWKSKEVKDKSKQTWLTNYGFENPTQSKVIQEKSRKSCVERYSVENPFQSIEFKEKIQNVCLDRYGVKYAMQSKEIQRKTRNTCFKMYGVENPLQIKEVREKCNSKESQKKRHLTMKKNNSYGKSKIEDRFYENLCKKFGEENVERQVRINNWNIDFYVKSFDVYIQLDGVYWHGLDRQTKLIKESESLRDKIIYKTYLRDQEQNNWFERNKLMLIRITDLEYTSF